MVKIEFETGNAAFQDGCFEIECLSILERIGKHIESGHDNGRIYDTNGNKIGNWTAEKEEN